MKRTIWGFSVAAMILGAGTAQAGGLVVEPETLQPEARATLSQAIAAERSSHPEAFAAVRDVRGYRPEAYKQRRNPIPEVGRELSGLGPSALLPMLNELAFEAPARDGATEREWTALKVGLLEAVGKLRDPRSLAVVARAFEANTASRDIAEAAARALGALGNDASARTLIAHTAAGDPLRPAAIVGLGESMRLDTTQRLAEMLEVEADDEVAARIAKALGQAGSMWAWESMGPGAKARGLAVREVAARALAAVTLRSSASVARTSAEKAMLATEHPVTLDLIRRAETKAVGAEAARLQRLATCVERRVRR